MDLSSALLLLSFISQGIGVATEISALAKRVVAGEKITEAELDEAKAAVKAACEAWDAEADKDR